MGIRVVIFALLGNLLWLGAAGAVPVTWHLKDVVFDDGGTASGSFVYDADTDTYSDVSIVTTEGSVLTGEIYDIPLPVDPGNANRFSAINSAGMADYTGERVLDLAWATALTNLGGVVAINIAGFTFESTCTNIDCFNTTSPFRGLVSGFVTTTLVPLPAALPLFAFGLGALGFARRRRA